MVPNGVTVDEIIGTLSAQKSQLLQSVQLFDIYSQTKEDKSEKSFSFSLIFQNDMENIKDEEIDTILTNILMNLEQIQVFLRQ